MGLKKLKPVTAGTRHRMAPSFDDVTSSTPEKSLLFTLKKSGGRNSSGRMTMRYIGGGHKQKARIIDFKRDKIGIPATVKTIEYDPTRSARVALLFYADGAKTYIIAPEGLKVDQEVISGPDVAPEVGNALPLAKIPWVPLCTTLNETWERRCYCKKCRDFCSVLARENGAATLKMPSGEMRTCSMYVWHRWNHFQCRPYERKPWKAGRKRWKGTGRVPVPLQ